MVYEFTVHQEEDGSPIRRRRPTHVGRREYNRDSKQVVTREFAQDTASRCMSNMIAEHNDSENWATTCFDECIQMDNDFWQSYRYRI
jgi:hypothetical protein